MPLTEVTVVPSIFPEAFGMVAAEAAAGGSLPLVARHSGLAEVATGLEESYPERHRDLASFETGDAHDLAASWPACWPCRRTNAAGCRPPRGAAVERWSWTSVANRLLEPFQ